jgi:hypothetical protein
MSAEKLSTMIWDELPFSKEFIFDLNKDFSNLINNLTEVQKKLLIESPNEFNINVSYNWLNELHLKLKASPGFVLIKTGDIYTDEELRCIYALYCRSLGLLNNLYGYFYDVIDQGLDYTKKAIPVSMTSASTGYHTDSTAKEYLPDIVGLLCLYPGAVGGDSLLTNAANLYNHLYQNFLNEFKTMQNPIIRDVITPGTTNSVEKIIENAFPIFSFPNEGFTFRYMRFWIESAYQKTGQIMPEELIQGLNETDRFFSSSQNHLQFRLERGDILLLNNRFICHNRTAFENNTASFDNHRKLVRSWINYQ